MANKPNYSDIYKPIIEKFVKEQFMKWLIERAKFFSFGPLSFIVSNYVTKILLKAIELGALELAARFIRIEVNGQVKTVKEIILDYMKEGSQNEQELKDAYDRLFDFGSSNGLPDQST